MHGHGSPADTVEIGRVDLDDLRSMLRDQGLEDLLDEALARPLLGNACFAQQREYCRATWLAELWRVRRDQRAA